MTQPVKGPDSYFPAIEKAYSKSIDTRVKILKAAKIEKHMMLVAFLKREHRVDYALANALVAHFRAYS